MPTMSSSFSFMLHMAQAPIPVQPLVSVGPSCNSCLPAHLPAHAWHLPHSPAPGGWGRASAADLAQSREVRTQATAVAARAGRAKEAKLNSIFGLSPKLQKPTLPRQALGHNHQQLSSAAIFQRRCH